MRTELRRFLRGVALAAAILSVSACTDNKSESLPAGPSTARYQGSAGAGDWVFVTVDHAARTVTYANATNGTSGTVGYSLDADGTFVFQDPDQNLVRGFEVEGSILVLSALKTGPAADKPSLIVAVPRETLSPATLDGSAFNFIQFHDRAAGLALGVTRIDEDGFLRFKGYSPFAEATAQEEVFDGIMNLGLAMPSSQPDSLVLFDEPTNSYAYLFGNPKARLLMDGCFGTRLHLQPQATQNFDPSCGGHVYKGLLFHKKDASFDAQGVETGQSSLESVWFRINSQANMLMYDGNDELVWSGSLAPAADDPEVAAFGSDGNGMFRSTVVASGVCREVCVIFSGRELFFSYLSYPAAPGGATPAVTPGTRYEFSYGVARR